MEKQATSLPGFAQFVEQTLQQWKHHLRGPMPLDQNLPEDPLHSHGPLPRARKHFPAHEKCVRHSILIF